MTKEKSLKVLKKKQCFHERLTHLHNSEKCKMLMIWKLAENLQNWLVLGILNYFQQFCIPLKTKPQVHGQKKLLKIACATF